MTLAPEELKACCAAVYASEAARWLLGDSFHPGGNKLTLELVRLLDVGAGDLVLDVASGLGTSAMLVAETSGCEVVGVDLSPTLTAEAAERAAALGLDGRVRFVVGDAEALPLADAAVDVVLCECSFCLFPDWSAAAGELARVLRPGGRVAVSDVVADGPSLPAELLSLTARVACVGAARPLPELTRLLGRSGFAIERVEERDTPLREVVDRAEARVHLARILADGAPEALREQIDSALELLAAARRAIDEGVLGYGIVVARRV